MERRTARGEERWRRRGREWDDGADLPLRPARLVPSTRAVLRAAEGAMVHGRWTIKDSLVEE